MTRDLILAQLSHAKAALAAGDCDRATGAIELAWQDLGAFSQQLAAAGKSTKPALKMHKHILQSYSVIRRRCVGEGLVAPTFGPHTRGDMIAPTFAPVHSPDLLAPTFRGPLLTEGDVGRKPWLGLAAAALMLAGGLWCLRR